MSVYPNRGSLRRLLSSLPALVVAGLCLLAAGVQAQALPDEPGFLGDTRRWLDQAVASVQTAGAAPLRMEVSVGSLDSRLRLASCGRVEPYLPVGTRLWGRTRLGLRCIDGAARWNVFLPVTIKAIGPAWVMRRDVSAGTVLGAEDVMEAEVDWAEENSPIIAGAGVPGRHPDPGRGAGHRFSDHGRWPGAVAGGRGSTGPGPHGQWPCDVRHGAGCAYSPDGALVPGPKKDAEMPKEGLNKS